MYGPSDRQRNIKYEKEEKTERGIGKNTALAVVPTHTVGSSPLTLAKFKDRHRIAVGGGLWFPPSAYVEVDISINSKGLVYNTHVFVAT